MILVTPFVITITANHGLSSIGSHRSTGHVVKAAPSRNGQLLHVHPLCKVIPWPGWNTLLQDTACASSPASQPWVRNLACTRRTESKFASGAISLG